MTTNNYIGRNDHVDVESWDIETPSKSFRSYCISLLKACMYIISISKKNCICFVMLDIPVVGSRIHWFDPFDLAQLLPFLSRNQ